MTEQQARTVLAKQADDAFDIEVNGSSKVERPARLGDLLRQDQLGYRPFAPFQTVGLDM